MKLLDLSLSTPEENLACDEALLEWAEAAPGRAALRFWTPSTWFVVVGYGNAVEREVNLAACRDRNLPILRRCSGGGTVLQGPGCLNYTVVLDATSHPSLHSIPDTNGFVMEHQRASLQAALGRTVTVNGHTDLAVEGRKVSGNAQRRRRHAILFHGTFLLKADFHLMAEVLPPPSREPDYRAGRGHEDFLTTLNLSPQSIQSALMETWQVRDTIADWPRDSVATLVRDHYSREEWNLRH